MLKAHQTEVASLEIEESREPLTKEVLAQLIADGLSLRQIASRTGWSFTNVRHFIKKWALAPEARPLQADNLDPALVAKIASESHSMAEVCKKVGIRPYGHVYRRFIDQSRSAGIDFGRMMRHNYPARRYEPEAALWSGAERDVIGGVSHIEVQLAMTRLGYRPFNPTFEGGRIDMVVVSRTGEKFSVQIKTVAKQSRPGEVIIPMSNKQPKRGRRHYAGDVDHVIGYDRRDGRIYALNPLHFPNASATLRLRPPKWTVPYVLAEDYLLAKVYPSQWASTSQKNRHA